MKYILTTLIILFTFLVAFIIFINYDNIVKIPQGEIIYTYAFKNEMKVSEIENLAYTENITFHHMNTGVGINYDYIEYDVILYIGGQACIRFHCSTIVNDSSFSTTLGVQNSDVYIGNRVKGYYLLYQNCIIDSPLRINIVYNGDDNYNVVIPSNQSDDNLKVINVIPFDGNNIINGFAGTYNFMSLFEPSLNTSTLTIDKIFDIIEYVFWSYPRYIYDLINTMLKVVF